MIIPNSQAQEEEANVVIQQVLATAIVLYLCMSLQPSSSRRFSMSKSSTILMDIHNSTFCHRLRQEVILIVFSIGSNQMLYIMWRA